MQTARGTHLAYAANGNPASTDRGFTGHEHLDDDAFAQRMQARLERHAGQKKEGKEEGEGGEARPDSDSPRCSGPRREDWMLPRCSFTR